MSLVFSILYALRAESLAPFMGHTKLLTPSIYPSSLPRLSEVADLIITYSPANAEAAQLYRENMKEYVRRVKATVEESWMDPEESAEVEEAGDSEQ